MANDEAWNFVFKIREHFVLPACSGVKPNELPEAVKDFQTLCKRTMDAFKAKKVLYLLLHALPCFCVSSLYFCIRNLIFFFREPLRKLSASPLSRIMLTNPYVFALSLLLPSYAR